MIIIRISLSGLVLRVLCRVHTSTMALTRLVCILDIVDKDSA